MGSRTKRTDCFKQAGERYRKNGTAGPWLDTTYLSMSGSISLWEPYPQSMIRLYFDPDTGGHHIGSEQSAEAHCGLQRGRLRRLGTVRGADTFTPEPRAFHDDCRAEFDQRHRPDPPTDNEKSGWVDMRESQ